MEIIGWIGSLAFSFSALPQAWDAYKHKTCNLNKLFLTLWSIGEIACLVYASSIGATPLIVNYVFNGICLSVIVYYNGGRANEKRSS